MSEKVKFKSPRGTALYPCLNRSETYKGKETGKYTLKLILTGDALEQVKTQVDEFLLETYGPKKAKTAKTPFKLTKPKDGEEAQTYIKFSTNVKTKDGDVRTVPMFDAKGSPVKRKVNLGSGSVVKVNGTMASFDDEPGVAFYLDAVQVIKLVEYQSSGGFEAEDDEDGFSGDEFDAEDEAEGDDVDETDEAPAKSTKKATTQKKRDF